MTRKVVQFNCDQRFADGWRRQLRSMFIDAGPVNIELWPWAHVDCDRNSYLFTLAERIANAAAEAGAVTAEDGRSWKGTLLQLASTGKFFSTLNVNIRRSTRRLSKTGLNLGSKCHALAEPSTHQ